MGVYWNLVNPAKGEYLDPAHLGWTRKMRGVVEGPPALAVSLLVCACHRWAATGLAGSWHGDAVYFASDGEPPHPWGIVTAAAHDPERQLYAMAHEEFTDISQQALAALAEYIDGSADEWVTRAATDDRYLVDLGYAAITTRATALTTALERQLSRGWMARCQSAFEAHPERLG